MRKILSILFLMAFALTAIAASPKTKLVSSKIGDAFWNPAMNDRAYLYLVWQNGTNSLPQTIAVPFEIAVNPKERQKYIKAAFSFNGTPMPTPTVWAIPDGTPTVTPTPDRVN